jgi:UDP-galactopyranose mutase
MLLDRGIEAAIIERQAWPGGLCITRNDAEGRPYEPYGARIFHTAKLEVQEFVQRFASFNGYTHRKGIMLNGKVEAFPICPSAIERLPERDQIRVELENLPPVPDMTNFETACVSIFGRTLYGYFIENYTRRMWGMEPASLTADWAPKRLELRAEGDSNLFKDQWQGLPTGGFSRWIESMSKGIEIRYKTTSFDPSLYDLVMLSVPIDMYLDYEFGQLPYRSMHFHYREKDEWEEPSFGTINLPQDEEYVRKCNFDVLHRISSGERKPRVQYQKPVSAGPKSMPMYPVNTPESEARYDRYLRRICESSRLCPMGRLGLFKYLDMDKAVEMSMIFAAHVEHFLEMSAIKRYEFLRETRKRF